LLAYAIPLALSLIWFLVSSLLGPSLLRLLPKRLHPRFKVMLWLGGLYSMLVSVLTAIASATILIFGGWFGLKLVSAGIRNLWYVLLVSLLPWALLALTAAALAAVLTRLEPARIAARQTSQLLAHTSHALTEFHGIPVRVLELSILAATLVDTDRRPSILITRGALDSLSADELEAVYWHEFGHAVAEHNGLNRIARVSAALVPWLPLTRQLPGAVLSLCEAWADRVALQRVSAASLATARSKFTF